MGIKGENARARIIECARSLFSTKGYCAVSMQDISKASGFSRGGLYRHFSSTEEIFIEIIKIEQSTAFSTLERAISENVPSEEILRAFLRSRINVLRNPNHSFDIAVSEFAANSVKGKEALVKRAQDSVEILTKLIENGNESGAFSCSKPEITATHILWILEGMSRHAGIISINDSQISQQIDLIERLLQI